MDRAEIYGPDRVDCCGTGLAGSPFGECHGLFFGMSLILRKRHPFANDFASHFVVFHISRLLNPSYLGGRLRWRAPPSSGSAGPPVDLVVAERRIIAFKTRLRSHPPRSMSVNQIFECAAAWTCCASLSLPEPSSTARPMTTAAASMASAINNLTDGSGIRRRSDRVKVISINASMN
jgi:hypothetical protein